MNKHISALSLTVISCILIFGFGFETDGIYKFKYSDHSPLDLSVSGVKAEKTDEGKIETTDWYSSAMSEIKKAEYIITFNEEQKEYQSPNRENNMRFIYHKDGFTAKLRNNKIALFDETDRKIEDKDKKYKYSDEWKLKLTAQNVKSERGDNIPVDMNLSEMKAAGNKASIENENLRIEYTNDERGMRQDFIIKKKPEGDGRLRLSIQAETKLKMIIGADALMFKDKNGNDKMKYSALKCWDVNGKELRAYFEKSNYELRITNYELKDRSKIETNSKSEIPISQFSIVVNDEGAVYPVTIDPLSTTLNWSAESNQENSDFGFSVATAGDVNGDGYSDVLIGASLFDNGQTDEGRVFVYHGSALGLLTTANWTAESNQEGSSFGYSVSTAGDVNNDGYSDVIIGAYSFANGQTDEGGAFIYHGSASGLAAGASIILESNQAGANFGIGVSTAGDVDGDGYSDVIIGATKYDNGETDEGMAFVYYGSEIGIQISGFWNAESDQAGAIFGLGVSTAGDVNGDGYSDVIIGAVGFDNGEISEGKVFAFLGSLSGLSDSANWTAEGNQASSRFGSAVSTAGDVNGDGYSDVLVGAYRYDNGQTDEGGVFIYVPKFSPDGKYIAYVEFNPSRNLCIIKTDGTGKTIVKDSIESVVSLDWSPDGNKIIIQHHDINSTLYTINRDGSDYKYIAAGNEPSWSPDGTKICYSKNSDIFFMNADGGDLVNITNTNSENENSPRWSPDSKAISYSTYDILKVSVCNIYKMETAVLADSASSAFWKYP